MVMSAGIIKVWREEKEETSVKTYYVCKLSKKKQNKRTLLILVLHVYNCLATKG